MVAVVGSVHGFLCLTDENKKFYGRELYLWNPSVKRFKTLVTSCYKKWMHNQLRIFPVLGLGFHKPINDYRIVRIFYKDYHNFENLDVMVEVFSLRRNTWKKIKNDVPRHANHMDWVFVDGKLYRLEAQKGDEFPESLWVLWFDLNEEVFGEVKCPDNFQSWVGKRSRLSLLEFKDSVSFCVSDGARSRRCCVWVMRDGDGDGDVSWTRQYIVKLKVRFGVPMKFTRSGKLIIVKPTVLTELVAYNLESLESEDVASEGLYNVDTTFIESLVLLDEGNELLRPAN